MLPSRPTRAAQVSSQEVSIARITGPSDRSADPGCDGYVRITIGVEDQVTRGLEALKASLNEIGWKPTRVFSADGTIGTREFE